MDDLRADRLGGRGFVLQQSAFRTDVLAPAMSSSNAVTLFASVTFGLTVFGESLSQGHGRLVPAIIGLAFALIGIVRLAGAKPPLAAEPLPDQPLTGQLAASSWRLTLVACGLWYRETCR